MLNLAVLMYVAAMLSANLLVAKFGPAISPVLAFFLIGFDLTMRDWLQVRLAPWKMGSLIIVAGALTYALNPAAGVIAIASSSAFTLAALADWATFSRLRGSWLRRSNGSNMVGAAVDSLVFPTLAFGALMPHIALAQFLAKVAGGALWSLALSRINSKVPA